MPVAIVVQRVTANQRQRSRSGFASGPPMVVRPKGESAMAARSARNRTLLIVKTGPKLRNIQSLKAVSAARKRAPCHRSEEHTSELQSLMRISYAVFCLKKKIQKTLTHNTQKAQHITH